MKQSRTRSLMDIINDLSEEKRIHSIQLLDRGVHEIEADGIDWKAILIYEPSVPIVKAMLEKDSIEYLIAIVDTMADIKGETFKVTFKKGHETKLWTCIQIGSGERLISMTISPKEYNLLLSNH